MPAVARGPKMHSFAELIDWSTAFTLIKIKEAEDLTIEVLQTSSATNHVKRLQMIQLQKVIMAAGMFSIFESILQDRLECLDGFEGARKYLEREGEHELTKRFKYFLLAINVLKHGRRTLSNARMRTSFCRAMFRKSRL